MNIDVFDDSHVTINKDIKYLDSNIPKFDAVNFGNNEAVELTYNISKFGRTNDTYTVYDDPSLPF